MPGAVYLWGKPLQYEVRGQEPQRGQVTAFVRVVRAPVSGT